MSPPFAIGGSVFCCPHPPLPPSPVIKATQHAHMGFTLLERQRQRRTTVLVLHSARTSDLASADPCCSYVRMYKHGGDKRRAPKNGDGWSGVGGNGESKFDQPIVGGKERALPEARA